VDTLHERLLTLMTTRRCRRNARVSLDQNLF